MWRQKNCRRSILISTRKIKPAARFSSYQQKKRNTAHLDSDLRSSLVFFQLNIKYQVKDLAPKQRASNVQVSLGIEWSKSTRHQKRVEKNVLSSSSARLKEMFNLVSRELSHAR
jgi:hypothetical protein